MTSFDRETPVSQPAETAQVRQRRETAALWSAIRADRRAQDERTARLRAMLLAVGADASA